LKKPGFYLRVFVVASKVKKIALTIHQYERGTDGPDAAQEIMTRDGRHWSDLSERLNRYQ
jgi:glucose-6-phosphate 1-dehydrogenase